jgi:hypothetical protein
LINRCGHSLGYIVFFVATEPGEDYRYFRIGARMVDLLNK